MLFKNMDGEFLGWDFIKINFWVAADKPLKKKKQLEIRKKVKTESI